jgi:hypothetical protein
VVIFDAIQLKLVEITPGWQSQIGDQFLHCATAGAVHNGLCGYAVSRVDPNAALSVVLVSRVLRVAATLLGVIQARVYGIPAMFRMAIRVRLSGSAAGVALARVTAADVVGPDVLLAAASETGRGHPFSPDHAF